MHHLSIIVLAAFLISTNAQRNGQQKAVAEPEPMLAARAIVQDTMKEFGKKIFIAHCYSCHKDSVTMIAPGASMMAGMSPRSILSIAYFYYGKTAN